MSNRATYLGNVVSVNGSSINVELTPTVKSGSIVLQGKVHKVGQVGSFVRIPQGYNDLFGIISETSEVSSSDNHQNRQRRLLKVELVGETIGIDFERGISQFPAISDEVDLVTEEDLKKIYGNLENGQIKIGRLSSADSIQVSVDLDSLVNKHSALVGSTGSGKSTSVASLLRSIITDHTPEFVQMPSARIILFDLHGEYSDALKDIADVYSLSPQNGEEKFVIPYWCISPDNLFDFVCGGNENLKNKFIDLVVEEKKKFVESHQDLEITSDKVTQYTPVPFRLKKVWYDLVHFDTVNWNDKEHTEPAYSEDGEGDFRNLIPPNFLPPGQGQTPPHKGGALSWKKQLELMRTRLLDSQYSFLLDPAEWSPNDENEIEKDLDDLLNLWVDSDKKKPITILDLSGIPSSRLELLLGSIINVLFESALWGRNLLSGMRNNPLLLVMEEAHRYLSKSDGGFAKEMVRRIAKEGRKFGIGSLLVSQRPSEIDETILSQCGTLFAMRITNATDRAQVKAAMSDGLASMIDSLPILKTGEAIVTGEAARLPMRFKFKLPQEGQFPDSHDPKVAMEWAKTKDVSDFQELINAWRQQKAKSN